MKLLIVGLAIIAAVSAGSPSVEYLPPTEDVVGSNFLEVEPAHTLVEDGYRYRTVKRFRHRRDVNELPSNEYLPPVQSIQTVAQGPALTQTVFSQGPGFSGVSSFSGVGQTFEAEPAHTLAADGYRYKTVKKYRHRRDVNELPAYEYLPPTGPQFNPVQQVQAVKVQAPAPIRYQPAPVKQQAPVKLAAPVSSYIPPPAPVKIQAPVRQTVQVQQVQHQVQAPVRVPAPVNEYIPPQAPVKVQAPVRQVVQHVQHQVQAPVRVQAPVNEYIPPPAPVKVQAPVRQVAQVQHVQHQVQVQAPVRVQAPVNEYIPPQAPIKVQAPVRQAVQVQHVQHQVQVKAPVRVQAPVNEYIPPPAPVKVQAPVRHAVQVQRQVQVQAPVQYSAPVQAPVYKPAAVQLSAPVPAPVPAPVSTYIPPARVSAPVSISSGVVESANFVNSVEPEPAHTLEADGYHYRTSRRF